jgi:NAD(P)-dependent dehydrogenase (short-subunit alcohol dehydrogenase family)
VNRVALITGGSRGIGLGVARSLATEGYDLAICGLRTERQVADILEELGREGTQVLYCQADVSDRRARTDLILATRERFGHLNLLVNNAGVAPRVRADILQATEESYDRVMDINLKGPYFLAQAVANWMIEQKTRDPAYVGQIVNITSISATTASPSRGEYCISKAGLSMATKLWAARLGEFDIPVYEVRPGIIYTDMTEPVKKKYDRLIGDGLLVQSRWGMPADVGKAVAMLARGELPYSTGQVIAVDGGFSLSRL